MEDAKFVRLGTKSVLYIGAAISSYRAALSNVSNQIQTAVHESHYENEDYMPPNLEEELEGARWWEHQLADPSKGWLVPGVNVARSRGAIVHSALLVQLDGLKRNYTLNVQDPTAAIESHAPRRDRIRAIEQEIATTWSWFGTSPYLARIREQLELRRSGGVWQALLRWRSEEPTGRDRVWCFCDSTFFLESRYAFYQMDWHKIWGYERVVLVVPQAMLRELDELKGDPRKQRAAKRNRAIQVLRFIDASDELGAAGIPVKVREGVELLVMDHEPLPEIEGLDPNLADDRLIAAALSFRNSLPEEHVVVVTDDRGPRFKAKRHGFERKTLEGVRKPLPKVDVDKATGAPSAQPKEATRG